MRCPCPDLKSQLAYLRQLRVYIAALLGLIDVLLIFEELMV